MTDFSRRHRRRERMDDPGLAPERLEQTLDALAAVNARTGGYAPSIDGVDALAGGRSRLSVLDVGTGAGDTPRRLVEWGRRENIELKITGIDLSETTVDYARDRCADYDEIEIRHGDLFAIPDDRSFDVVHAGLMLHHLDGDRAAAGLDKMYRLSRRGVVVNDLHRHPVGYYGSHLVLRLLTRDSIVHHDGPVSMLRGFTHDELLEMARDVGAPVPRVRWWPLFRWQMIVNH